MNYKSFNTKNNYSLKSESNTKFNPTIPSIIFTNGPTGSGKSGLLEKTIELLYNTYDISLSDFKSFLIDDYIENSDFYKDKIKDIIKNFNCNDDNIDTEKCDLENPSKDLLDAFSSAYFEIRNQGPCYNPPINKRGCKDFYNNDLHTAIINRENILIETTGKKIPLDYLKLVSSIISLEKYNIIFVYSIVTFEELIKRNKSRAQRDMDLFISSNYTSKAPRLPDIIPTKFKETTTEIKKHLIILRNICMSQSEPPQEKCGEINKDGNFILLIFDNNNKKSKLIYDNRTNDEDMDEKEFTQLLSIYNLNGGKRKLKYSKKKIINKNNKTKRKN